MTIVSIVVRVCICVLVCCKLEALGTLVGSLEVCSPDLWLSDCALVFAYFMQSLSYMLWMTSYSMTFLLESENKIHK